MNEIKFIFQNGDEFRFLPKRVIYKKNFNKGIYTLTMVASIDSIDEHKIETIEYDKINFIEFKGKRLTDVPLADHFTFFNITNKPILEYASIEDDEIFLELKVEIFTLKD